MISLKLKNDFCNKNSEFNNSLLEIKSSNKSIINSFKHDYIKAKTICTICAYSMGIEQDIMHTSNRQAKEALARQIAMYLIHTIFSFPLNRIAPLFNKDKSTVSYACHLIEDKREASDFDDFVAKLETAVCALPNIFDDKISEKQRKILN